MLDNKKAYPSATSDNCIIELLRDLHDSGHILWGVWESNCCRLKSKTQIIYRIM